MFKTDMTVVLHPVVGGPHMKRSGMLVGKFELNP